MDWGVGTLLSFDTLLRCWQQGDCRSLYEKRLGLPCAGHSQFLKHILERAKPTTQAEEQVEVGKSVRNSRGNTKVREGGEGKRCSRCQSRYLLQPVDSSCCSRFFPGGLQLQEERARAGPREKCEREGAAESNCTHPILPLHCSASWVDKSGMMEWSWACETGVESYCFIVRCFFTTQIYFNWQWINVPQDEFVLLVTVTSKQSPHPYHHCINDCASCFLRLLCCVGCVRDGLSGTFSLSQNYPP